MLTRRLPQSVNHTGHEEQMLTEKKRTYIWQWMVICLVLLLISGCAGRSEAADASPDSLPAGESDFPIVKGAPIGRPSFGPGAAGSPEKLSLPSIGLETDVVPIGWHLVTQANGQQASEWEVADFAAGWHKNSTAPGKGGNVVLSGHNNIKGAVFRKLYTLKEGDIAHLWSGGKQYTYKIDEVMILEDRDTTLEQRRANAQWIQPFDDDRLTLVSCWPENDNSHRVVVIAHRVQE